MVKVCNRARIRIDAAAVVGTALLLGVSVLAARQDPATATAPREIEIVARRFAFEPALIEVTEGERVRLMVRSGDGVHGLEIKELRVNKVIPRGGKPVAIEFTAPKAGTFEILCSEYCGDGHDAMTATLVVHARPGQGPIR
jgi:cytochrome c oxidase subunit 2